MASAFASVLAAVPFLLLVLFSDSTVSVGAPTSWFWLIPIAAALLAGWTAHPLSWWQRLFVGLVEYVALVSVSFFLISAAAGAAQDTATFLTFGLVGWTPVAVPFLAVALFFGDRLRGRLAAGHAAGDDGMDHGATHQQD